MPASQTPGQAQVGPRFAASALGECQVTLKLIETFVDKCEDLSLVIDSLVPAMMDPILGDYARNVPDARYKLCPNSGSFPSESISASSREIVKGALHSCFILLPELHH